MKDLANRIATRLMTFHSDSPIECERLQLMKRRGDGTEQNCGGRNKQAVINEVLAELKAWKAKV